jgi:hypothetical protein
MKNLINTSLALLFAANLSAQNPNGWIEEGAEWHHKYWVIQTGYTRHYLEGTETINDTIFQIVKSDQQLAYPQPDGSVVVTDVLPGQSQYKFFTSGDSVFIRKDSGLQFVWHRNPQVGDIWDFGVQGANENGDPIHAYAVVQGLEPIEIAGIPTFDILAAPCKDAQGTLFENGELDDTYPLAMFVSRINNFVGPRHDFSYIGQFHTLMVQAITSFYYDRILCYSSDETNHHLFAPAIDCNNGILSTEKLNLSNFTLFPNPATTTFSLTHPEHIQSVQIYDVQGRLQLRSASLPIDVRSMTSGVYWVQIETVDGQVKTEKLVVE